MKQNSEFIFWANIFIVFVGLVVLYKLHGPITWTYYMDLLHMSGMTAMLSLSFRSLTCL